MTTARTQVSLYKSIERYGYLHGNRDDTEATAAEIMRDFIVIPRSDLPEVRQLSPQSIAAGTGMGMVGVTVRPTDSPADMRNTAAAFLALAEHLEAHPPVDEAQVDALTKALYDATADPSDIDVPHVARRLVAAGVRAPQAGDDQ